MQVNNNKYFRPVTIKEALMLAGTNANSKFIAGGTDIIPNTYQGNTEFVNLIDLKGIKELYEIESGDGYLKIGSMVRLAELKNNRYIKEIFPSLIEAADSVGTPLIRNSATIGGNLLCENRCYFYNQSEWWRESIGYCLKCEGDICIVTGTDKACYSEFVSDTAPVLISLNAKIEIEGVDGIRSVLLEDIYTGDGLKPVSLRNQDILKNIIIPTGKQAKTIFKKFRQRESLEFTWLTTVITFHENGILKIVLGGVDPKPVIINDTINTEHGQLIKKALQKCRTVNNNMSTRNYRRAMIKYALDEGLENISGMIKSF